MFDRFSGRAASMDGPATHGFPVTPHDSDNLPEATRAIYVGGAGTLVIQTLSGADITFATVAAGTILPIRAIKVKATTTATMIVGLS